MSQKHRRLISIVVPCYNEEAVIAETVRQLVAFGVSQPKYIFEYVFVDDGSLDRTVAILQDATRANGLVRLVQLSRNFGHQIAVTAGIDASRGDAVVLIDADLQDPIHLIAEMIQHWEADSDVVYGTRARRHGESLFKIRSAHLFYRLLNRLSDVPIPIDTGDFRLMSRRVVEALKAMPEQDRFVRGMVAWVGYRQTSVSYDRAERFAGESKYPFKKMLKFAFDGILSFSTRPLRVAVHFGFACAGMAILGAIYMVCVRAFDDQLVAGWASTMFAIFFLGGVQLVSFGLLGEYVGRIYREVKHRPLYVASEYLPGSHH